MKIKEMKLKGFRSYVTETTIEFDSLTAIIGKNDVGKSTILEALDIFFNDGKGVVKFDRTDVSLGSDIDSDAGTEISVTFCDLPDRVIIDDSNDTSFEHEHLLKKRGLLEIVKRYHASGQHKTFIRCMHPRNPKCKDLLSKSIDDLRMILDDLGIPCEDRTKKAVMRASIWKHYESSLDIGLVDIELSRKSMIEVFEKIQNLLPAYSLFQSDRKNSDTDDEVQDPLKEAVKAILKNESVQDLLKQVASLVEDELKSVSSRTLEKLRDMNPSVADSLSPSIPSAGQLKWADVFKSVSIYSDDQIPINKRGSGTRRLILLNFFRAEVEHRQTTENKTDIIYAIEEPETSQHTENQKMLVDSLLKLAATSNTQIVITTHSPTVVRRLGYDNIRIVKESGDGRNILRVSDGSLPYVSLNEVNYLAFSEISEEYHNELYGYIESRDGWIEQLKKIGKRMKYTRIRKGRTEEQELGLPEYVRHQIHHPENMLNKRFDESQLRESIEMMRTFIGEQSRKEST